MHKTLRNLLVGTLALGSVALAGPYEDLFTTGVAAGSNGWLFHVAEFGRYKAETPDDISEKLRFIGVVNQLFKDQGIDLVVAMVPGKIHIYEDQLPKELPLGDVMKSRYQRAQDILKKEGVKSVDLMTPMLAGKNSPDEALYPIYQKLDHHWSSRGAMVAAKAVADYLQKNSDLSKVPEVKFDLKAAKPETYQDSSLLPRLPKAAQANYKAEAFIPYDLNRLTPQAGLLDSNDPEMVLVGSSASKGGRLWPFDLGIPYFISREVANAAQAGRGPWLPMEDYLRNIAFQRTQPKVVVWQLWEAFLLDVDQAELPKDWILNLAPLVQNGCKNGAPAKASDGNGYVEFNVAGISSLGTYLSVDVAAKGIESLQAEVRSGDSVRQVSLKLGSDGESYRVKVPLYLDSPGSAQTVRLLTGKASSFKAQNSVVCGIPAYATQLLTPVPTVYNLASVDSALRINTEGLSGVEAGVRRWAIGKESQVSFWSAEEKSVKLNLKFYNPIEGQEVTILLNGKPLEVLSGLKAGQNVQKEVSLPIAVGKNSLVFRVKAYNGNGSDFAKGDSRPLSIMFNQLELGL